MQYYLKHNIQFAPYLWNWYAWSHLIPPHTAAANIAQRHIKIMESFVSTPELHWEAIHTHGMIGGPFINLGASFKDKIADLLTTTKQSCAQLIALQNDIKNFSCYLKKEARGFSLENHYKQLPVSLQGMVELVYDLHNQPQLRLIEPLIYAKYYQETEQSICLAPTVDDHRPFSLSTPLVSQNHQVQLSIPFASSLIDELAIMKYKKGSLNKIIDQCNIPTAQLDLFTSFFTEKFYNKPQNEIIPSGVNIKYFGHACVLLQTAQTTILLDPTLGYDIAESSEDRLTALDLPDTIDYVLITHNHQDHFLFETLLPLRHKIKTIIVPSTQQGMMADPSLKLILKKLGFKNIQSVDEFEEIHFSGGVITGLPFYGEHADLNIQSKRAYHIRINEKCLLFLADSNNMDNHLYAHIYDWIGAVDVLFIGMECVGAPASWLYGPLFPEPLTRPDDQSRRLSGSTAAKAWEIVRIFSPKEVYVYAMGMEPWLGYIMAIDYDPTSIPIIESNQLIAKCNEHRIIAKRLFGKACWHI